MQSSYENPIEPHELTDEEGAYLVKLARKSVETYLKEGKKPGRPKDAPSKLLRPGAAFVTIETFFSRDRRELRGCIGYIEPIASLVDVVIDVAIAAAVSDPRFPPMDLSELDRVTFEVSVLGRPVLLDVDRRKLPDMIEIGRHGLIIERGLYKGLLLPQVPVEYGWDAETFLAEACMKAGLPPDAWLVEGTKVYVFEAAVFQEVEPKGPVVRRNLKEEYEKVIKESFSR